MAALWNDSKCLTYYVVCSAFSPLHAPEYRDFAKLNLLLNPNLIFEIGSNLMQRQFRTHFENIFSSYMRCILNYDSIFCQTHFESYANELAVYAINNINIYDTIRINSASISVRQTLTAWIIRLNLSWVWRAFWRKLAIWVGHRYQVQTQGLVILGSTQPLRLQ